MRLPRRATALAGCALALAALGCAALGQLAGSAAAGRERERRAAVTRWAARPFTSYRLVMEEGSCYADVEVRGERIAWGHEVTCGRGKARTIANLFALAADDGGAAAVCGAQGCVCENVTSVRASYDSLLGYPRRVEIETHGRPNWAHPDLWRHLVMVRQLPECAAPSQRTVTVLALLPQP